MRRIGRARYLALTLAGLLVSPALVRGSVLCIGAEGHSAIEQANAVCCPTHHASDGDAALARGGGCASACTDAPLGIAARCQETVRSDVRAAAGALLCACLRAVDDSCRGAGDAGTLRRVRLSHTGPPRYRRTTVHLC
jgi:hypothetical protein